MQSNIINLIDIKNLNKKFAIRKGLGFQYIHAVNNVSINVKRGETFALVGESGCGKSTLGKSILRIIEPSQGQIIYNGKNITNAKMLPYRRKMQMIFQNTSESLDPRLTTGEIIGESIDIHKLASGKKEREDKIKKLLETVGLSRDFICRFPHELSGGQQQRIGIARALAVEPEFIVCDEAVSSLDVSIQAQILNMLIDMQHSFGLTYFFISHDLAVVRYVATRIAVMYLGNIVEIAKNADLYKNPIHPYTKTLLSSVPMSKNICIKNYDILSKGDIPNPLNLPQGCCFHTRCQYIIKKCKQTAPALKEVSPQHFVACHII
jgi:oligopeptide transport system ATP-binding protein